MYKLKNTINCKNKDFGLNFKQHVMYRIEQSFFLQQIYTITSCKLQEL